MTTDEVALLENTALRRYYRQGKKAFCVRVYDNPTDETLPMPRAGEYFPGETSGYRIFAGAVSCATAPKGMTGLRITITAMYPQCEQYVVVKKTTIPTSVCLGYYSPDATLEDDEPVSRRQDGRYKLYWVTASSWWRIEEVETVANYWTRTDPDPVGDFVAGGGDGDETVTLEALTAGEDETFAQEIIL